jgi:hypothetical protein
LYSVLIDGLLSDADDACVDGAEVEVDLSFFEIFGVEVDFTAFGADGFFTFGVSFFTGLTAFGFADLAFGDLPFFPLRQDLHQLCGITSICALRRVLNNSRTFRIPVADVPHLGHSACIAFPMCQSSIR